MAKNYTTCSGKIDIIAKDKNEFVFIDVKTRCSKRLKALKESINYTKKGNVLRASKHFVYKNNLTNKLIRFDIIEVYINGKDSFINHLKNIFS